MQSQRSYSRLKQASILAAGLAIALGAQAATSVSSVADASVDATTATTLYFTVSRSGDAGYDLILPYATVDDGATSPTDFSAATGSLTIPAGAQSGQIPVAIPAHSGPAVSFFVNLNGASGVGPALSFAAHSDFTTGTTPVAVAVADLNNDGRPDVIDADSGSNSISAHINFTGPGDATPTLGSPQAFPAGVPLSSISAADLNNDGRPDLLIGAAQGGRIAVVRNTTASGAPVASFDSPKTFAAGLRPRVVNAADFNGDGRPDLLISDADGHDDSAAVLINTTAAMDSNITFAAPLMVGAPSTTYFVTAADLNGDGRPDLITANRQVQSVSVFINTTGPGATTPSFSLAQTFACDPQGNATSLAAVDLNGDGRPDLVVGNARADSSSVLFNTTVGGSGTVSFTSQKVFAAGAGSYVGAVDLNGDGRPELLASPDGVAGATRVAVSLNRTAPGAAAPDFGNAAFLLAQAGANSIRAADFNSDGKPDLIVANRTSNTLSVLLNTTPTTGATPGFAAQQLFSSNTNADSPFDAVTADFNNDGRPDVATANRSTKSVSVLLNATAAGALQANIAAPQTFATGDNHFPTGANRAAIASADFNGDGRPDLVTTDIGFAGTVSVLLNVTAPGSAVASFAPFNTFAAGDEPNAVTTADVNGDGKPDIEVINRNGNVSVLTNVTTPGAGVPSFAAPLKYYGNASEGQSIAAADLDGDGVPDLVTTTSDDVLISVLQNVNGSFFNISSFVIGGYPTSVKVADLNGDGRPDLVAALQDGQIGVLIGTGESFATGSPFRQFQVVPAGANPANALRATVAVADLNGDGRPDLLLGSGSGPTVSVLYNTTPPGAATVSFTPYQTLPAAGPNGAVIAAVAADFNGDGQPDVLAADYRNDRVSVLLNSLYRAELSATPYAVGTIQATADTQPDAFVFTDVSDAPAGTSILSNIVVINGLGAPAPLVLSGPIAARPQYAINGGKFKYYNTVNGVPMIGNGDSVQLRAISSQAAGMVDISVSIGSVSDTWTLTTPAGAGTPNAFDFKDKTNVPADRYIGSGGVRVSGINTPVAISISGDPSASFRINNGAYVSGSAMVSNGDLVVLRLKSAAMSGGAVSAMVTIGGVSDRWTVTTQ